MWLVRPQLTLPPPGPKSLPQALARGFGLDDLIGGRRQVPRHQYFFAEYNPGGKRSLLDVPERQIGGGVARKRFAKAYAVPVGELTIGS